MVVPLLISVGATALAAAYPERRGSLIVAAVACGILALAVCAWAVLDTFRERRRARQATAAPSLFEDGLTGEWRPLHSTGDPSLPYGFLLTIATKERLGLGLRVTCSAPIGRVRVRGSNR